MAAAFLQHWQCRAVGLCSCFWGHFCQAESGGSEQLWSVCFSGPTDTGLLQREKICLQTSLRLLQQEEQDDCDIPWRHVLAILSCKSISTGPSRPQSVTQQCESSGLHCRLLCDGQPTLENRHLQADVHTACIVRT